MSEREFWDRFIPVKERTAIVCGMAEAYIFAGISLISALTGNPVSAVFAVVFGICGFGLQKFKSKVCAVMMIGAVICRIGILLYNVFTEFSMKEIMILAGLFMIIPIGGIVKYLEDNKDFGRREDTGFLKGITLVALIPSVLKYHKIKEDYDRGENSEFFEGDIPMCNPYDGISVFSQESEEASDFTAEKPSESEYGFEEFPTYSQPENGGYTEPWEIDDIKPE